MIEIYHVCPIKQYGLNLYFFNEIRVCGVEVHSNQKEFEIDSAVCELIDYEGKTLNTMECILNNIDKEVFLYFDTSDLHIGKIYILKFKIYIKDKCIVYKSKIKIEE